MDALTKELFAMQDKTYQQFQGKLIPTVEPAKIIGIRTPMLRAFAKTYSARAESAAFLEQLPHTYYEENNLHAFLIEQIRELPRALAMTKRFLPYIDNWATCDMFSPPVFKKNPMALLDDIHAFLRADHTYTVRYGIGLLMSLFLDCRFDTAYPALVADVRSEEYYINMMCAWYFATALAKQYDAVLPYFTERRLCPWVHKKAIQKAVESRRLLEEQKRYLKTLR